MSGPNGQDVLSARQCNAKVSPELKRFCANARKASEFLKALAHENRLLILCVLAEREHSVTELEVMLSLSQPTVSQQLGRLRLDGIVEARREGRVIYYRLADDATRIFIQAVYDKFCSA